MSKSHTMFITFKIARLFIEKEEFKCANLKSILTLVIRIFGLKQLSLDSMPCWNTGFFTKGHASILSDAYSQALVELRPHMIPLVEYKQEIDNIYVNMSAIGNEYGDIYETQLNQAIDSKLNEHPVPEYFESLVMPMIRKAKL